MDELLLNLTQPEYMNMTDQTAIEQLAQRMLSFDENAVYDGYPTMTCSDEGLISAAMFEHTNGKSCTCGDLVFLSYLASEHVTTREQYDNAKRFIQELVESTWDCNMCEGDNPVYDQIIEEEDG